MGEAPSWGLDGTDGLIQPYQRRVFEDAARRVAALVGDGCVIRVRSGRQGDLVAVAADHHDADSRNRLRATLTTPALAAPGGWVGQALERDCVLRLPEIDPETLVAAGLPPVTTISDVVVVPIAQIKAVIIAVRDLKQLPLSFAERLLLERIAADVVDSIEDERLVESAGGPDARKELPRLLDLTAAGLWLVDAAGTTIWVNEAASELVGVPASELVGARVPEFIAGADGALGGDLYAEHRSDRKLTRPDGSEVWLSATARPLFDERGRPEGTLMTMLEINDRKQREVELRMRLEAKEALVGLAELSLDAPNLRAILAESAELLAEQLDAAVATISTVDVERREITILAAAGQSDATWAEALVERRSIRLAEGSVALATIEAAEPMVVEDFEADQSVEPSPELVEHGIRSMVCVPVGDGESVVAALSREPGTVGEAALPLIESVARVIANYRALVEMAPGRECSQRLGDVAPHLPISPGCNQGPRARPRRWSRRPGSD